MAKSKAQVQFEADTSGFTQGIKEADKSLVTLRKELNLNSAELKENADDVDLLSKRKNILQNELDQTSSKIENLKNKLEVAKSSFGENSKEVYQLQNKILDTQTAFQKIQNELTQTDSKLSNLETELNSVEQEMKQVDQSTDNLGDGFTTMKGAISSLIADGVSKLSESLKDLVVDSDTAYSNFQAQTGASAKEMKQFESVIEETYSKNFGDSINDIANAMSQVKQQTKETDPTNLQKMTENALTLRDTFDFDVAESMRAVNSLMTKFGISSEEAFNLVVQGAQGGLNANGDMLDVINEYSVQYKNAGYSANDMFNMLMNGAESGTWSIDKMGDAMKEFNIRMSDGTVTSALEEQGIKVDGLAEKFGQGGAKSQEAMNEVIQSIMSVEDETERYKLGVSVFGTMWEDLGEETVVAMMKTEGSIDSAKQSMEEMIQVKMDNITTQIGEIGRMFQTDFLIPVAEKLLPKLKDGLQWIGDNLNWLLPIITGIGIAVGTYFVVSKIMGIIGTVKTLIGLVKSGTTVMGALNTVMALNPVALIVAGIVGLIAVFVLLWNKCDWFREFWIKAWEDIKTSASNVWKSLKTGFKALGDFIGDVWETIKKVTSTVWNGIKSFLSSLWNGIKSVATSVFDGIKKFISSVWEGIKKLATSTWNAIKTSITNIINSIKTVITNVFNSIKSAITTVINTIKTTITNVWNGIKTITSNVFNSVKSTVSNVWNGIKTTISNVINGVKNTITSRFNSIKSTISNVWNSVKSTTSSVWNSIKSAIQNPINNAKTTVKNAIDKIKGYFKFSWSLPKPKIPSFSVSGGEAPWGFMGKGKLPSIKIKWNKDGAIFTKPTVFETNQGLQGVGEAGAEAVLPIEKLENWINRGFSSVVNNNYYANEKIDKLVDLTEKILNKSNDMYVNGRKVSESIASDSDSVQGQRYNMMKRGLIL